MIKRSLGDDVTARLPYAREILRREIISCHVERCFGKFAMQVTNGFPFYLLFSRCTANPRGDGVDGIIAIKGGSSGGRDGVSSLATSVTGCLLREEAPGRETAQFAARLWRER